MSWPVLKIAVRLRLPAAVSAAIGLIAVQLAVGALFPAVGHAIGKLNIPKGVAQLLGGADYGTITGWFRSEIGSIYGPLVIGALAIVGAAATTAGEEEDRILALVLAHPITRARLVAAKAAAIGVIVLIIALATWAGMIFGVGVAAAVGIVGWLINGFAPLVSGLGWSKYLSLFYYYAGHDPLTQGVDIGDIIVLLGLTLLLTGLAMLGIERRDLRG